MKKLLIVFSVLLTFTGCQIFSNKAPDQGTIDHVPQDRRIGTIQSLGEFKTSSNGTDLLTMADGSTILLKSLNIQLNDPKYLNTKVEVSGVLTYTTDGKQMMEVQSIDILDTDVKSQESITITWRDYINAAKGFQIKYRDDFTVEEDGDRVSFTRAVSPSAVMTTEKGGVPISSMQIVAAHVITIRVSSLEAEEILGEATEEVSSKSRIGIAGIEADKFVLEDGQRFTFDDGKNFYKVTYSGGQDSQSLEDQNIFYEFLASFKLLNPTAAVSQQTVFTDVPATPVAPAPTPAKVVRNPTTPLVVMTPLEPAVPTPPPVVAPVPPATPAAPVSGYETFTSAGYKFSIQYPKGWYFGQSTTTESGISRRYDFGTKPVEEVPGNVFLDIGTNLTGGYTFSGKNGRVYRLTGPGELSNVLKAMIGTIQEQ